MFCIYCGSSNKEGNKFCIKCGKPLHTGAKTGAATKSIVSEKIAPVAKSVEKVRVKEINSLFHQAGDLLDDETE